MEAVNFLQNPFFELMYAAFSNMYRGLQAASAYLWLGTTDKAKYQKI